jgi:hypothetical protein
VKASRTWSASCADKLYVCADGHGPARCTEQQASTVDPERAVRVKALSLLTRPARDWFTDQDISQGDWQSFATLLATVNAMTEVQLKKVDPRTVYASGSAALGQAVQACMPNGGVMFKVNKQGAVSVPYPKPCAVAIVNGDELAPLRLRADSTVLLLPGIFGVKPAPRPVLPTRAAPAPSATAPATATALPQAVSPQLDAAVRKWVDSASASIVACTNKNPSAVLVDVDGSGKPTVSVRGAEAGGSEEGCVRSALGAPPALPSGPAQILHVVKTAP